MRQKSIMNIILCILLFSITTTNSTSVIETNQAIQQPWWLYNTGNETISTDANITLPGNNSLVVDIANSTHPLNLEQYKWYYSQNSGMMVGYDLIGNKINISTIYTNLQNNDSIRFSLVNFSLGAGSQLIKYMSNFTSVFDDYNGYGNGTIIGYQKGNATVVIKNVVNYKLPNNEVVNAYPFNLIMDAQDTYLYNQLNTENYTSTQINDGTNITFTKDFHNGTVLLSNSTTINRLNYSGFFAPSVLRVVSSNYVIGNPNSFPSRTLNLDLVQAQKELLDYYIPKVDTQSSEETTSKITSSTFVTSSTSVPTSTITEISETDLPIDTEVYFPWIFLMTLPIFAMVKKRIM